MPRQPEHFARHAAAVEAAGLDELWLWEDCFLAGGIAASATALAATRRIVVGLGVMPAVFRDPVACAMEIATLARLHPSRFIAGLGHGVPAWMERIGALPDKPVWPSRWIQPAPTPNWPQPSAGDSLPWTLVKDTNDHAV